MVIRANGASVLGLREPDPPEERDVTLVLPRSAWKQLEADAQTVGMVVQDPDSRTPKGDAPAAISQLIADLIWHATAPQAATPVQPRTRKAKAARSEP